MRLVVDESVDRYFIDYCDHEKPTKSLGELDLTGTSSIKPDAGDAAQASARLTVKGVTLITRKRLSLRKSKAATTIRPVGTLFCKHNASVLDYLNQHP